MAKSKAKTVREYLDELPAERKKVLAKVRSVVRKNLPRGYQETVGWGMISYGIPLKRYPDTYNKQPLCYAAIAAQKNHYAIYLMTGYTNSPSRALLKEGFKKAGKKLDMGQSCIRFRKLEDIPLDIIGRAVASTTPAQYIELYERHHK
jgi:hypothetical protein